MIAHMYQHSLRMQSILEDLLLLSRLEIEDQPLEIKKGVAVATMLKQLAKDAENYGKKNHHITIEVDKKLLLTGSEHELKSLFSNLIINAVKYTPNNGSIYIKWYLNNDHAIFQVIDSGIGIAKKHIPRLTERFYRVDKARSRDSGGTGLGLAIVKHVLLRHQGELLVDSIPGQGSTFTCIFPLIK